MKHQQVSVDYYSMGYSMFTYLMLIAMGWVMMRLFSTAFTLPGRLRSQQQTIQERLEEFQRRYPNLNVTEQDMIDAEKEMQEWLKEVDDKEKKDGDDEAAKSPAIEEDKKSI